MVGVNVGIPVPAGIFPFAGTRIPSSGFACVGKDGMRFLHGNKSGYNRWFHEEETKVTKVSTWDGAM